MYDDDHDALAAEYVLGTLPAAEREQAEALLARDAGFAETVRLWEHRLGELNVMVEAVEPPPRPSKSLACNPSWLMRPPPRPARRSMRVPSRACKPCRICSPISRKAPKTPRRPA